MTVPIREIIIRGDIAIVPLTAGHEAIIDSADVPLVAGVNWTANRHASGGLVYATRNIKSRGTWSKVIMHRLIMNAPPDMHVDHCDGDSLNCRRSNMRIVTVRENNINRGIRVTNKCGLKGVCRKGNRFIAAISLDGVKRFLGAFATAEEAYAVYCNAGKALHGEFWRPA